MRGADSQKVNIHSMKLASKSSRKTQKLASATGTKRFGRAAACAETNCQRARDLRFKRNKNVRDHKRATALAEKRASRGAFSSPRVLAIVALSSYVDVEQLTRRLVSSALMEETGGFCAPTTDYFMETEDSPRESALTTVAVPRFNLRLSVVGAPREDLQACLEVVKVSDIIVLAVPISKDGEYVDKEGKEILSLLRGVGFPTTTGLIVGLRDAPLRNRADAKKAALEALQNHLPVDSKCFPADSVDDFQQIIRHLAHQRISGRQWRSERPYIVAQELKVVASSKDTVRLSLSGYCRGRGISVNQLVHLAGVGDFQFSQIDALEDPYPLGYHHKGAGVRMGEVVTMDDKAVCQQVLLPDPALQESVVVENNLDSLAGEQTWPTDEEQSGAVNELRKRLKKQLLPSGMSAYQASWIVEGSDKENEADVDVEVGSMRAESMSDRIDEDTCALVKDDEMSYQNGIPSSNTESVWDHNESEHGHSDMIEELTQEQRAGEIQMHRAVHWRNEEFPDEIDTPTDKPARERFAKYRGLKSLRTSHWDPKESLPCEYSRIFAFDNFAQTCKHVLTKAREIDQGGVAGCASVNTYVRLHIKDVPLRAASALLAKFERVPVVACGLLQHESKMSVLHFRPMFSSDGLNMDKHKFERFLPSGQIAMASVFAPVSFSALPVIVFKDSIDGVQLVASGSLRSVDPDQIILKKIILSGFPQKVSKRKAVVQSLFHNAKDVRWFKPLELWTKCGRRGRIKESVGTHGSMKCIFDGEVQQRDTVCVSLYKRVYPKWPLNQVPLHTCELGPGNLWM